MKYSVDNIDYDVVIEKKKNKNLYIRVKDDLTIYVTANYFTSRSDIVKVLDNNIDYLRKMITKRLKEQEKKNHIYYLGKQYDLVVCDIFKNVDIDSNKIYVKNKKAFDKWYKQQTKTLFENRLEKMYDYFEEKIPFPSLKIRTMKTRWGVCNIKTKTITLNSKLIEYNVDALDYVIVHELSHLIHFNHSKYFWNLVEKYVPDYKKIRLYLKE